MRVFKKSHIACMTKLSGSLTQKSISSLFHGIFPNRGVSGPHTLIKMLDGSLRATGSNVSGELGTGNKTTIYTFIQSLGILGTIKSISVSGNACTFVLTEEGDLYYSGTSAAATRGGLGATSASFILLMSDVKEVSNFNINTLILKNDNSLWGAGVNSYSQLTGSGQKSSFTQIMTDVADMALGTFHSIILKIDGSVWVASESASPGLGEYTTGDYVFRQINSLPVDKKPVSVQANYYSSIVVMEDGTVYGSGNTTYGELGVGHRNRITSFTRLLADIPLKIKKFSLGRNHSAALFENGDLYMCGDNNSGKLGLGSTSDYLAFTKVISNVSNVGATMNNTFVIKDDGTLWGCGTKSSLGIGVTSGSQLSFIPITITD